MCLDWESAQCQSRGHVSVLVVCFNVDLVGLFMCDLCCLCLLVYLEYFTVDSFALVCLHGILLGWKLYVGVLLLLLCWWYSCIFVDICFVLLIVF